MSPRFGRPDLLKIFLPLLPVLEELRFAKNACLLALTLTGSFWLTVYFFRAAGPLFPRNRRTFALLCWVGTLACLVNRFTPWGPSWAASLYLLLPENQTHLWGRQAAFRPHEIFKRGFFFAFFGALCGLCMEIAAKLFPVLVLQTPAGALLFFSLSLYWMQKKKSAVYFRERP